MAFLSALSTANTVMASTIIRSLLEIDRTSLDVVALVVLFAFALALGLSTHPRKQRPPGPAPERLLGNARQIPSLYPWLWYTKLSKTYGATLSFRSLFECSANIAHRGCDPRFCPGTTYTGSEQLAVYWRPYAEEIINFCWAASPYHG